MTFGFTKSVLVLAAVFAAIASIKADWADDMALTRVLAPIMFYVVVMLPVALGVDLWRWWKWR